MKKTFCLALAGLLACTPLLAARLSLKMSGGFGYYPGGDFNAGLKGLDAWAKDFYDNVQGSCGRLDKGWESEAELELELDKPLSLGLAVGYRRMQMESKISYDWNLLGIAVNTRERFQTRLASVPLTLFLHARFPLGRLLRLNLSAGLEYCLHWFRYGEHYESTVFLNSTEDYAFQASRDTAGLRAGAGLEAALGPHLSLILEMEGRSSQLTDLGGSFECSGQLFGLTYADSGQDHTLWYYEESQQGKKYPKILFARDPPLSGDFGSGRAASLGLSGLLARAGLRLSF
jgi:hypothetical protein